MFVFRKVVALGADSVEGPNPAAARRVASVL